MRRPRRRNPQRSNTAAKSLPTISTRCSARGGNIAVLTGPDGALVVDSDVRRHVAPSFGARLALVSDKPSRFLVNTHFHFDHTGGNPTLGRTGAVIVAQDNVRKRLMARQVINLGTDIVIEATPPEGLPVVTFENGLTFHVNGEEIAVIHVENAPYGQRRFRVLREGECCCTPAT